MNDRLNETPRENQTPLPSTPMVDRKLLGMEAESTHEIDKKIFLESMLKTHGATHPYFTDKLLASGETLPNLKRLESLFLSVKADPKKAKKSLGIQPETTPEHYKEDAARSGHDTPGEMGLVALLALLALHQGQKISPIEKYYNDSFQRIPLILILDAFSPQ